MKLSIALNIKRVLSDPCWYIHYSIQLVLSSYPDSRTLSFSFSIPTLNWLTDWRSPSSCPPCRNCQPTSSFLGSTTGNFLRRKKCCDPGQVSRDTQDRRERKAWSILWTSTCPVNLKELQDPGDVYCVGCLSVGPTRYLKCCAGLLHDPDYSSSLTGLLYQLEIFNLISKLFLYQLKIKLNIFHCLLRVSKI